MIAAGSSTMGGVNAQTTQIAKTYTGSVKAGTKLIVYDSGIDIVNITTPKEANYIYFNYKSAFTVHLGDKEITLSEQNSSQNQQPGGDRPGPIQQNDNPNGNPQDQETNVDFGSFLGLSKILILFVNGVILL